MSFFEFFIRKHVFTWMLMFGLIFFGAISFQRVGISEFPDVDFPVVSIQVSRDGSSPQLNEIEIADPIENAISAVQGIKKISSTSRTGRVEVVAEFDLDKDIDVAIQDVQAVLSRAQRELPSDIDPPVIRKTNPEDQPILWIGVSTTKLSRFELMGFVRDQIKPQFSTVDGVADIFMGGYIDPNLRVWAKSDVMKKFDISAVDMIQSIQQEHVELPAGRIESQEKEYNVRTYGEAKNLEEFANLPILRRGGSPNYTPLKISDVADLEMGLEDDRFRARAMGETSVGLGFRKQRGVNAVEVAKKVKEKLLVVREQYKNEIQLNINFDTTTYIKESVDELLFTLFFSALLTSLVCFLFLGSLSATFNVVLAIPTAIMGSFIFIDGFGFTLNTFTLLGLSMAVGIVVDDAIMILENITRHRAMGKSSFQAAVDGSKEIFFAVLATTASLLAIFTPVAYVSGVTGKYLLQFGLTLSMAVFLSMIEALTLTPMRFAQFQNQFQGKKENKHIPFFENTMLSLEKWYSKSLARALENKKQILVGALVVFFLSLLSVRLVPKEFAPYQDVGRIMVMVKAPQGVSIHYMDEKFKRVEEIMSAQEGVLRYFGFVGGGEVNSGRAFVSLKPLNERKKDQRTIANELRQKFKAVEGLQVIVQDNMNRGFSGGRGYPVEFFVLGPDFDKLAELADNFKKKMTESNLMIDVDTNYKAGLPEYQIVPNRLAAAQRGVSVVDINKTIQALVGGIAVGKFTQDGYRYDIRLRLKEDDRASQSDIEKLTVRNNRGETISLADVITVEESTILQEISRENRQRAITLSANVKAGASQDQALKYIQKFSKDLPVGYQIQLSGSAEAFQETFLGLILAMALGLLVTYMLLGSQFNSFLQPVIILLAIPFSLSGAFLALLIFGQSLNIYSMIGILLVLGLVLKNSIMLVDFTNKKISDGLSQLEALKVACPLRLRPILMTSLATIVGALPAAMAFGPGAESRIPMALTVIGGMIVSTLFTLFVVPCFYLVVKGRRTSI